MKALVSKTVRKVIALLLILMVSGTGNVLADVMYYVHTDHLGTPVVITDSTQKNVWQGNKQPFGKTDVSVNLIEFNVRFPGQYYDQESGLHYNYFRTYDPSLGRYLESDPIGLRGGLNTYAYVDGNPLTYVDPYGQSASLAWCFGGPAACALGVGTAILTAAVLSQSPNALNSGSDDDATGKIRGFPSLVPTSTPASPPPNGDDGDDDQACKINEKHKDHIFRDAEGHLTQDTAANRSLLEKASVPRNYVGTDRYGNQWHSHIRSDGSQVWTKVRNGMIDNGGVNSVPRQFNPETGLSSPTRGW